MKKLAAVLFLKITCISASIALAASPISVSPNKKYKVDVVDKGSGKIFYTIVDREGKSLAEFLSSYQATTGTLSWAKKTSAMADVQWTSDSSLVAISEANHQYMGTIFLAMLGNESAIKINLPTEKILNSCGVDWSKVRIIALGWQSNSLQLGVNGSAFAKKGENNVLRQGILHFKLTLKILPQMSLGQVEKATY